MKNFCKSRKPCLNNSSRSIFVFDGGKWTQTSLSSNSPKTETNVRAPIMSSCLRSWKERLGVLPRSKKKRLFHLFIKCKIFIGFNLLAEENRAEQTVGGRISQMLHGWMFKKNLVRGPLLCTHSCPPLCSQAFRQLWLDVDTSRAVNESLCSLWDFVWQTKGVDTSTADKVVA